MLERKLFQNTHSGCNKSWVKKLIEEKKIKMTLNKLFGGFRHHAKTLRGQNQLAELQRRAQKNPDNLNLQIRMADLFIKLGKKDEALEVYRQAAEKYTQKSLVRQAIALNKIILRLAPSQIIVDKVPPGLYSQRMDEGGETGFSVK